MKKSTKITTNKERKIEVYTDGSAKGNGTKNSIGGWGYIVLVNGNLVHADSGCSPLTTNQKMELQAAIEACNYLQNRYSSFDNFTIFSDSAYLINCVNNKWYNNWLENGWTNSKGQPVANKTYWQELLPFFDDFRFKFVKVKGHSNIEYNNFVDELAQNAANRCKKVVEKIKKGKNNENSNN